MTIEVLEDGYEVYFERDVEYNLNGHKWVSLKANLNSPTLKKGDLLSLRCSLMPGERFGRFMSNGKAINLRGNILSLIFKDDINLDISGYSYVFRDTFFYHGNNIVSVEKNFLPATTLAEYCYAYMFHSCTSLVDAPELPATTLEDHCYAYMFHSCTSLVNAPELPATTLEDHCYAYMFYGCTKLNYIKMLATNISATSCLNHWVYGVATTGTFVKNPAMTTLPTVTSYNNYEGIPSGWTVVNDGEESDDNLITFYINSVEAHAEEGMTFYDWILSDYFDTANPYGIAGQNIYADVREFVREYGLEYTIIYTKSGFEFNPNIHTTDTIIDGQSYNVQG
jgi:hypothetical protein